MQDLKPTFEHYYPEGSIGPGTGALRGQCAVFAEVLVTMPLVGDTLLTKTAALKAHGVFGSNCQVGDVLILNVGTTAGHVAVINGDAGDSWRMSESNYHNDLKVNHTRLLLKNSPQIVGYFRGALKVSIINPSVINFKVRVVANTVWNTLPSQIQKLKDFVSTWSAGRINLIVDSVQSSFTNIPYSSAGVGVELNGVSLNVISPDSAWYEANVSP